MSMQKWASNCTYETVARGPFISAVMLQHPGFRPCSVCCTPSFSGSLPKLIGVLGLQGLRVLGVLKLTGCSLSVWWFQGRNV